jgi:hypothetical protein
MTYKEDMNFKSFVYWQGRDFDLSFSINFFFLEFSLTSKRHYLKSRIIVFVSGLGL